MCKYKTLLAMAGMVIVVSLGFVLPGVMGNLLDRYLERWPENVPVDEVQFESGQNLTVFQRLQLIEGETYTLYIDTGNVYDEKSAFEKTLSELKPLLDQLGIHFNFNSCWTEQSEFIMFYDFDFNNNRTSMIVWNFSLCDSGGELTINGMLEEESGKLLSLSCNGSNQIFEMEKDDNARLADIFTNYWGTNMVELGSRSWMEFGTDGGPDTDVSYSQYFYIILSENDQYLDVPVEMTSTSFYI